MYLKEGGGRIFIPNKKVLSNNPALRDCFGKILLSHTADILYLFCNTPCFSLKILLMIIAIFLDFLLETTTELSFSDMYASGLEINFKAFFSVFLVLGFFRVLAKEVCGDFFRGGEENTTTLILEICSRLCTAVLPSTYNGTGIFFLSV
ncbi:hypothetical protein HHL23_22080 [Chryseobacterium sp. RP-3-3]|uniref:Uncharacterized protein n=1 Tax=Chryseobacterium antibioticum TaxID=2728847 RepID=A0A7Y0FTL6_9FLAO|nr:hypothetical protein [Chryseobacterium antibioticum]NML72448.1 hypothetical protein [Chryseobacterium antibioticum]